MPKVQYSVKTVHNKEREIRIDCANLISFCRDNGIPLPTPFFGSVELEKDARNTLIFKWNDKNETPDLE